MKYYVNLGFIFLSLTFTFCSKKSTQIVEITPPPVEQEIATEVGPMY